MKLYWHKYKRFIHSKVLWLTLFLKQASYHCSTLLNKIELNLILVNKLSEHQNHGLIMTMGKGGYTNVKNKEMFV